MFRNIFILDKILPDFFIAFHAVDDDICTKAALTETRGRDWRGEGAEDSPRRRFRLAFHAGDWRLAGNELAALAAAGAGEYRRPSGFR